MVHRKPPFPLRFYEFLVLLVSIVRWSWDHNIFYDTKVMRDSERQGGKPRSISLQGVCEKGLAQFQSRGHDGNG